MNRLIVFAACMLLLSPFSMASSIPRGTMEQMTEQITKLAPSLVDITPVLSESAEANLSAVLKGSLRTNRFMEISLEADEQGDSMLHAKIINISGAQAELQSLSVANQLAVEAGDFIYATFSLRAPVGVRAPTVSFEGRISTPPSQCLKSSGRLTVTGEWVTYAYLMRAPNRFLPAGELKFLFRVLVDSTSKELDGFEIKDFMVFNLGNNPDARRLPLH